MATQSWRPLKTLSQGTIGCEIMQPTGSPGFGLTEDSRTSHIAYKQSSVKLSQFSMEGLVWQDSRTTDWNCLYPCYSGLAAEAWLSISKNHWLLTWVVCALTNQALVASSAVKAWVDRRFKNHWPRVHICWHFDELILCFSEQVIQSVIIYYVHSCLCD